MTVRLLGRLENGTVFDDYPESQPLVYVTDEGECRVAVRWFFLSPCLSMFWKISKLGPGLSTEPLCVVLSCLASCALAACPCRGGLQWPGRGSDEDAQRGKGRGHHQASAQLP